MTNIGRVCLYCSKPICAEDRVAACDRCYTPHHEECWNRNGRCSTFRCPGMPRTMLGGDVAAVLQTALDRANDLPVTCPFCSNTVYAGALRGKPMRQQGQHGLAPMAGLIFVGKGRPNPHADWFGKQFLAKMLGNRSWVLPGAQIRARSCGKCRRMFLWGSAVDEGFVQRCGENADSRICPHCAIALYQGSIALAGRRQDGARFECDDVPNFHTDWFGHNVLDRFVLNRWPPTAPALPAQSCPECHYTEIEGRAVYRV